MKDYQLAWRNLWRNKRRTLITSASVFFAVFFALVMRSFQLGAYDRLFKNVIESFTGYIQLQHKDYLNEEILNNSFVLDTMLPKLLEADVNVKGVVPRFESYALAAAGSKTKGVIVLGIDPGKEEKISDLKKRLVKFRITPGAISALKNDSIPGRTKRLLDVFTHESYSSENRLMLDLGISDKDTNYVLPAFRKHAGFRNGYLETKDSSGVVIGNGLSNYLKAGIGDTIVLIGQGYHGASAAGKYFVKGIIRLPAPDIDNAIVYLNLNSARKLYDAPEMATSAVISVKKNDDRSIEQTAVRLRHKISDPLVIRTWREMNALLVNQMEADNRSGMIMIGILYLLIAFGVFGTVLMMMAERRREFGMLVSVGMQKRKLAKVVSTEMLLTGFIGLAAGVAASLPFVFYGHFHPIRLTGQMARMYEDYGFEPVLPTLLPGPYYLWQVIVVLLILAVSVAFIIRKIMKMNVINSLRA